jgi:hypothetical protein
VRFDLLDRPGQRRLRDAQPRRRATEVQFLGDGHEVRQLPGFQAIHTLTVSPSTKSVFARSPA